MSTGADVSSNRGLHKAARLLWSGTDRFTKVKRDCAEYLCNITEGLFGPHASLAKLAAQSVQGLPVTHGALTGLLQGDECFQLQLLQDGDAIISLNVGVMVEKAKGATSTGVLLEDLPFPAGFVMGEYPLRPTQRNCAFYLSNGYCAFGRSCVFNHPAQLAIPWDRIPTGNNNMAKRLVQRLASAPSAAAAGSSAAAATAAGYLAHGRQPQSPLQTSAGPSSSTAGLAPAAPPAPSAWSNHTASMATAGFQPAQLEMATGEVRTAHSTYPLSSSSSSSLTAAAAAAGSSSAASASKQQQQQQLHSLSGCVYPISGTTPEGLPHRPGAANCPFYMHTASCKFGRSCMYHHPDNPPQPIKFLTSGYMTGKWPASRPVPYARLVLHISRLWDYTSSPETQLKTWLARHLLAEANPGCAMWSGSAAAAAAGTDDDGGGDLYSCSLSEAGIVLHKLWQEQPVPEAAGAPMPYQKRLRELFSADPYFLVAPDSGNASHYHVKLNLKKLRETLNW